MDGTLIDTEPAAASAVVQAFASWGQTVSEDDSTYVTGRKWSDAFDFLFAKHKVPVSRSQAEGAILQAYHDELRKKLHTVPGSVDAVRSLVGHFRLALVSGSGRADILWALGQLGILDCFEVILGAEDYPASKPAPDGYLKAMGHFGTQSGEGLAFEDSTAGIASARAAGLKVVAITSTNYFKQDVSQADERITDLTAVTPAWIRSLGW